MTMHGTLIEQKYWFCVRTSIGREVHAKWALDAKGYETFLPLEKRRSGKKGQGDVYRPVIPRYLFCREAPSWWPIRETQGVDSLLMKTTATEAVPALVPDGAVQAFRRAVEAGIMDRRRAGCLTEGQAVKIIRGPWAHFVAKISKVKSSARVEILLELFGSTKPVEISALDLVAV